MVRRVRGFRVVIDKAETHMSRWAEQENVFTRYLPYAVVFGLTDKWAKAFEGLGTQPDTSSWYVGSHAFTYAAFGHSIDGFSVTTGGTLASTPSGSGIEWVRRGRVLRRGRRRRRGRLVVDARRR